MVNGEELEWLNQEFYGLTVASDSVEGSVTFTANWDANRTGREFILSPSPEDESTGETLIVSFGIRISPRHENAASRLPELTVEGLSPCLDRHLQQPGGAACLISPLEEEPFLSPQFSFRLFFEQLILPFLYGQQFYELHGGWPWAEYTHGVAGVLESYYRLENVTDELTAGCLNQLQREPSVWVVIRSLLQRYGEITGFERCLCPESRRFKDCHPDALLGLRRLRRYLKAAPHLRAVLARTPSFQQNRSSRRRVQRDKLRK
jgi:hypothetical protein